MSKLVFKTAEKSSLVWKDLENVVLEVDVKSIKQPWDLRKLLADKFSELRGKVEIDVASFRELKFGFEDTYRDVAFLSFFSANTSISFSMKAEDDRKADVKEWTLVSPEWDKDISNLMDSFELVKRLQNTPPNILTPEKFVQEAREALSGIEGLEIKEIAGDELEKENLNLIRAVGRASVNAPRLLLIKYSAKDSKDLIALVGKGVCYDSGGLNIKTGPYMSSMKFDMSGGAVSLGVIRALALNKSKQSVVVAIPLVENSVAGNSYRPDDIVVCRNGMSIEIDNTDAEGRLVLADALAYSVAVYKPKEVITIATLTGAIGYALGSKYGGAWATSDEQWASLLDASLKSSEWIWRMPLDDYYLKALKKTRVADLKNSTRTGAGGSNRAARFLQEFTNKLPYIHLDIANIDHCESSGEPRAPLLKTLYFYLFR